MDPQTKVASSPAPAQTPRAAADVHIDDLLELAVSQDASDIHLRAGRPPALRVHGALLVQPAFEPLGDKDLQRLLRQITSDAQRALLEEGAPDLDLAFDLPDVARFRAHIARERGALTMAVRRLPLQVPTLDDLRLPSVCKDLAMRPRGLVLVTGPSGSGRSTTLAAMLEYLNERQAARVITCEDPVEFLFTDKRAMISQREVGTDTPSLSSALQHALRQDPDVILVSELRGAETTLAALTAAETGHLVLAGMSVPGATLAVERIIDQLPVQQQALARATLANVLEGVLAQALLPAADGQGRVAAVEIMLGTPAVRNLIRESKTNQINGVIETGQRLGMRTLDQALLDLHRRGAVTVDDILVQSTNPDRMRALLQAR